MIRSLLAAALVGPAVLAGAASASAGSAQFYLRTGIGSGWPTAAVFTDVDCAAPANYFGCGIGEGGLPTGAYGWFIEDLGLDFGVGLRVAPFLRLEAEFTRRWLRFSGNANFINAGPIQPVTANVRQFGAMAFAYLDVLSAFGIESRIRPFVGAGIGASRTVIGEMLYLFPTLGPNRYSIMPGGIGGGLAWALTAGVGIGLSERATLEIAYRYGHFGTVMSGPGDLYIHYNSGKELTLAIDPIVALLNAHEVRVSLRWALGAAP